MKFFESAVEGGEFFESHFKCYGGNGHICVLEQIGGFLNSQIVYILRKAPAGYLSAHKRGFVPFARNRYNTYKVIK